MPLYKNNATERKTINGQAVEPGQTISTEVYLSPLPTGITKLSDSPFYNPIVLSASYTSTTTVAIPAGINRFNLHFYVESGSCTIAFNDAGNTPVLSLYATARWNQRVFDRWCDKVIITIPSGKVWLIIEKD
jgi:hypothetical protein